MIHPGDFYNEAGVRLVMMAKTTELAGGARHMIMPCGSRTMLTTEARPRFETVGRNPGVPLDLGWVEEVRINRSAVERRAATLGTRRTVKKQWQAAWLLRAITCLDLTTLAGDDTPGNVRRLNRPAAKTRRDQRLSESWRPRDRHGDIACLCPDRQLESALR
jgi:deoxyribose-phosphate aldolase